MKKTLLLLTLLVTMLSLTAQDKVTVKFTAKDQNGKYCPFAEVEVTNVTRNWTATLHYPDTVLTLTPTGVGEYGATACRLGNAFPNPFTGETRVPLELGEAAEVQLRIVRIDGTEMASRALRLDAGTHHVDVRLASPGLSFLIVTTPKGSQVAKLVSESGLGRNAIEVKAVASRDTKSGSYDATGDFVLGDMMKYVGKTTFESAPVTSVAVTQAQSADATVVLVFPVTIPDTPSWPNGTLPGKFSVSATQQVQFSQGNLQYTKSTGVWSFMEHQYDRVETSGQNVEDDYANQDVISFFGWGTSGWNNGNTYYQPWNTYFSESHFLYGPSGEYDLTGSYANADWGVYNPISNGGNVAGMWRTLTKDEWVYVFNTRSTASGIRFAKAQVNDVNGVIILPDDWNSGFYALNNANENSADFTVNNITDAEWYTLEQHGAVFLPALGYRRGSSITGSGGAYWSTSYRDSNTAYRVWFGADFDSENFAYRGFGLLVRLVLDDPSAPSATAPIVTTADVTDITETTATAGGNITDDGGATVTERGVCWSTNVNPTTADDHSTASLLGTSSFTVSITGLTANTTYHVRAYATNSEGTAYGEDKSFTTLSEAPVTPTWPDGTLPGYFSVSAGQQVQFSQGNLQYTKSTDVWSFMEHQYDMVETTGQNVGENYANQDIISLFGWGTGEYPSETSTYNSNYYNNGHSIEGSSEDWGVSNPISNGGNAPGKWHTLTQYEWDYVIFWRSTPSGIRYAKAQVNNVNGVILLPDDWDVSYYSLNNSNSYDVDFSSNVISLSSWTNSLEVHGAVFLPTAGCRAGTSVNHVGSDGYYWSTSINEINREARYLHVSDSSLGIGENGASYGCSVRLVCPAD